MKTWPRLFRKTEKGSVAVEMALILPLFVMLLTLMVFFARIFWAYSATQKAAHDAARFLSTATQAEIRTTGGGFNEARYPAVARWIAQQELMDIVPWADGITILPVCDDGPCNATRPATVRVRVEVALRNDMFPDLIALYLGNSDISLKSKVVIPYPGR
ncbi:TadE/TadG family type IV pilus assembly protein [Massilia sp. LC238]|uniref:TadE/TadG family type IV pilus assembly protein n=1 Tax=Massilia sp. LC238 TaxID=1502852 RepID=UPI0004E2D347|nr:TadE family protein [Massilia sp. LC238]KFC74719.1 Flp pilus assembly protein TadG [Massilia sp. LC238]